MVSVIGEIKGKHDGNLTIGNETVEITGLLAGNWSSSEVPL